METMMARTTRNIRIPGDFFNPFELSSNRSLHQQQLEPATFFQKDHIGTKSVMIRTNLKTKHRATAAARSIQKQQQVRKDKNRRPTTSCEKHSFESGRVDRQQPQQKVTISQSCEENEEAVHDIRHHCDDISLYDDSLCSSPTTSSRTVHRPRISTKEDNSPVVLNAMIRKEYESMTEGSTNLLHGRSSSATALRMLTDGTDTFQFHGMLGSGAFSTVSLVTVESNSDSSSSHKPTKYYACKSVKEALATRMMAAQKNEREQHNNARNNTEEGASSFERREYVNAVAQLMNEIHVLNTILDPHPNIIQIKGMNCKGLHEASQHNTTTLPSPLLGLFLLTNVLDDVLDQRLDRWRRHDQQQHQQQQQQQLHPKNPLLQYQRNIEKYDICLQLAAALEYIHSKNIVYRDLKPQNIGFLNSPSSSSSSSQLQLFDFGLCCELTPKRPQATGIIGTMRYMSPEICMDRTYGLDADIYSYGIQCWEIWTHRVPFEQFTPDLYQYWVCHRGYRPPDYDRDHFRRDPSSSSGPPAPAPPSDEVVTLLSQTWQHDPHDRLGWEPIRQQLVLMQQLEHLRLQEYELLFQQQQQYYQA